MPVRSFKVLRVAMKLSALEINVKWNLRKYSAKPAYLRKKGASNIKEKMPANCFRNSVRLKDNSAYSLHSYHRGTNGFPPMRLALQTPSEPLFYTPSAS